MEYSAVEPKDNALDFVNSFCGRLVNRFDSQSLAYVKAELMEALEKYDLQEKSQEVIVYGSEQNDELLKEYFAVKKIQGLSDRTLTLYINYLKDVNAFFCYKPFIHYTTEDIYRYLAYKKQNGVTLLNNIRRYLSAFFTWLHDNGKIAKSPVKAIGKIKETKKKKKALKPLEIEKIRDAMVTTRDRALFEFLLSSAIRISECMMLNRDDIDFSSKEFVVLGKGSKERICFFNDTAAFWLKKYLSERKDNNEALFVTLDRPFARLMKSCVEQRFRELGRGIGVTLYPHKLRRTAATIALKRGMRLEDIQIMLGHTNPNTTLIYTQIEREAVKFNHNKFLG